MMEADEFDAGPPPVLLAGLYGAAEVEAGWTAPVEHLARALGATQATLQIRDAGGAGGMELLAAPGVDPASAHRYVAHYHHLDPYVPHGQRAAFGEVVSSARMFAPQDHLRSEYWNDFARHAGRGFHLMGVKLAIGDGRLAMLGFLRPDDAADFEPERLEALRRLAPHARGALRLWQRLRGAEAQAALMRDALGPCLVTDGAGRLLLVSPAAEQAAPAARLRLGAQRLGAADAALEARLLALVARTAAGGPGGTLPLPTTGAGSGATILRVSRLGGAAAEQGPPFRVLVELATGRALLPSEETLRLAYGLSASEAGVARMAARGMRAAQIAWARGTSLATVRTQLRAVLEKSGAAGLPEFIAMAMALG